MFGKKENKAPKPIKEEKKQAKLEKKESKRDLKEQKKQDKKEAKEQKKQEKKDQDALKPKTPSGEELSESIAAVMKDYKGPVTTSIVSRKVQMEHPSWKLNDKRMNKFIKRFMDSHRNPAGADDDQTTSFRSSKKGLFGRLSSRKLSVEPEAATPEKEDEEEETPVPPSSPKADPVETVESKKSEPAPEVAESDSGDATPVPSYPEEDEAVVQKSASKEIAYHTDNTVVDASQDCWGLGNQCSVM